MFCENLRNFNFLIFQPIFIRFSLLCLKIFTLSSDIKLNLLWSSSLSPHACRGKRAGRVVCITQWRIQMGAKQPTMFLYPILYENA